MTFTLESHNKKNKDNIAKTLALIFKHSDIVPDYLIKKILDSLIWATTENDDFGLKKKYNGQPYWSIGALKKIYENKQLNRMFYKDLRHEHSIPRNEIYKKIIKSDRSVNNILDILNKYGHAVIICKAEDEILTNKGFKTKMPKDFESLSIFARYQAVGIKVCDVRYENLKALDLNRIQTLEHMALT